MTSTKPDASVQQAVARLSLVPEGEDVLVGNPATATFVAVPEVGAVVLRALARGDSMPEAAAEAQSFAGVEVDVADFLATLEEAGVLAYGEDTRQVRWIGLLSPRWARPFFNPVAWALYGVSLVFSVVALIAQPALRPSFEDYMFLPNPMVAWLVLYAIGVLTIVWHEGWHWLAARAAGVPARFRLSQRGMFLVAETDLTLLLTLPRRRRYAPLLAGPAVDVLVLAVSLGVLWLYQDGAVPLNDTLARLLQAVVLIQVIGLVWQCAVFLRSDLYAVLACALRCENLYRASWLTLKGRLLRLRPAEAAELAGTSERDRATARWFSGLYVVGMVLVFWFQLYVVLPAAGGFVFWMYKNLASLQPGQPQFWESAALLVIIVAQLVAPLPLAIRERRLRRKGVLS